MERTPHHPTNCRIAAFPPQESPLRHKGINTRESKCDPLFASHRATVTG